MAENPSNVRRAESLKQFEMMAVRARRRQVYTASGYLAKQTLLSVGDIFVGARRTMDWLTSAARIVAGAPDGDSTRILEPTDNHKPYFVKHRTGFCLLGFISDGSPSKNHGRWPARPCRRDPPGSWEGVWGAAVNPKSDR